MATPRESFQLSGIAAEFKKVVSADYFDVACDYAVLQLLSEMPSNQRAGAPVDPYTGMDSNAQMHGARRVLDILKSLAEPIKPTTPTKRETIYH